MSLNFSAKHTPINNYLRALSIKRPVRDIISHHYLTHWSVTILRTCLWISLLNTLRSIIILEAYRSNALLQPIWYIHHLTVTYTLLQTRRSITVLEICRSVILFKACHSITLFETHQSISLSDIPIILSTVILKRTEWL